MCIILYIYMQWKKNFIILYCKIPRIIIRSKMEPYKFSKWLTHAYTVPPQIHLIIAIDNQEIRLLDNQLESSCYATKRNNTFVYLQTVIALPIVGIQENRVHIIWLISWTWQTYHRDLMEEGNILKFVVSFSCSILCG